MREYVLAYLTVGIVVVAAFPQPIRNNMRQLKLMGALQGIPRLDLRLTGMALMLRAAAMTFWPLYLIVTYAVWRANRPMTEREIDQWIAFRQQRKVERASLTGSPLRDPSAETMGEDSRG